MPAPIYDLVKVRDAIYYAQANELPIIPTVATHLALPIENAARATTSARRKFRITPRRYAKPKGRACNQEGIAITRHLILRCSTCGLETDVSAITMNDHTLIHHGRRASIQERTPCLPGGERLDVPTESFTYHN